MTTFVTTNGGGVWKGKGSFFFSPNKKFILRGIGEMAEGQMDIFVACFALSNGDVLLLRASGALC